MVFEHDVIEARRSYFHQAATTMPNSVVWHATNIRAAELVELDREQGIERDQGPGRARREHLGDQADDLLGA